jgi:hypothetical protein
MAGLLTHELVRLLAPLVEKRLTSKGLCIHQKQAFGAGLI